MMSIRVPAISAQEVDLREGVSTPGLLVEAAAGWDGTVDQSAPVPVSFLFSNYTGSNIDAQLMLSDPLAGRELRLGDIFVSPESVRQFSVVADLSQWYDCVAVLRQDGKVLWSQNLPLTTGNSFDPSTSFLLYVTDSGRSLPLAEEAGGDSQAEQTTAAVTGRPVRSLRAATWQIPRHHGPLVSVQAMIFSDRSTVTEAMNRGQWKAIADWLCLGGTLFVHADSAQIDKELTAVLTLTPVDTDDEGSFGVQRVGLGRIITYRPRLFAEDSTGLRKEIAEVTSTISSEHISALPDADRLRIERGGRADLNRIYVVVFLLCYTLFSGVVTLVLFRLSRRRIVIYAGSVVLIACIVSGVLGAMLRMSVGDLRWMTVTQIGDGGAVQIGNVVVQSAGGRSKTVAVRGRQPDLQFTSSYRRRNYYYYWNDRQTRFPPFTWQPSLAPGEDDTYRVNVALTPWGERQLHATDMSPDFDALEFSLAYSAFDQDPFGGTFQLDIRNDTSLDLVECWLLVGSTRQMTQSEQQTQKNMYRRIGPGRIQVTEATDGSDEDAIETYHLSQLPEIPQGAQFTRSVDAAFQTFENDWDLQFAVGDGSFTPPRIAHLGSASAWVIGRLRESPLLTIDSVGSDFLPRAELHLLIQEIPRENIQGLSEITYRPAKSP